MKFKRSETQAPPSNTKSFKKASLNKDEELYAFKKYFIGQLELDQKMENKRIELISNEYFALEKAFQILARIPPSDTDGSNETDLSYSHEISASTLHSIVCLHNSELTVSDCESFLYTFQKPMTQEVFKEELVMPLSQDFADLLE